MKRIGPRTCVLFAAVFAPVGWTQALSVDWKLYGGASLGGDNECFYDAEGVLLEPDVHIRIWTKCLLQKDMDSIDIERDFEGRILERTAEKIARYYEPPIAIVMPVDVNKSMVITQYEETANIANIQPRARIFYELNCNEQMVRELSIYVQGIGKSHSSDKPSDWRHVPPEGNGASLLKILCPR